MTKIDWLPLESNPEILNSYLENLGVEKWKFVDIWSFDDDLLNCIPEPTIALLFCFPVTDDYEKDESNITSVEGPFFIKQTVRNACGTIAIIHAIGNNIDSLQLKQDSIFAKFFEKATGLDPYDRARLLESEAELMNAHQDIAQEGQSAVPNQDQMIDMHFVAFVSHNGRLYELDGRKHKPIDHGPCPKTSLLKESSRVCREFISKNPNSVRFTALALIGNQA